MNKEEFHGSLPEFVSQYIHTDVATLSLKFHGVKLPFSLKEALIQIEARNKTASRLSFFNKNPEFLYPSVQAAEQATNQSVAVFHAFLTKDFHNIADLTAGLGIDVMTFARFDHYVTAFEIESERAACLENNITTLNLDNIKVMNHDSIEYLKQNPERFDCIFIDPARRDSSDKRVFRLQDSLPNVTANEDLLLSLAPHIFIKGSPLLDISQTFRDLRHIADIHIVSVRGECKEVLIHLSSDANSYNRNVIVSVCDIDNVCLDADSIPPLFKYKFDCNISELASDGIVYAKPEDIKIGDYVYELGAGMRKLNPEVLLCRRFPGLKACISGSGIFVSGSLIQNFPGRTSNIRSIAGGKDLKLLRGVPLRIVSHGHPLNAANARLKYNIREGDVSTLFLTSLQNKTPVYFIATACDG